MNMEKSIENKTALIIGGSGGLGTLLDMGRSLQAMDLVFSIMIIIGVIGTIIDNFIFVKIERSVFRKWGIQSSTN